MNSERHANTFLIQFAADSTDCTTPVNLDKGYLGTFIVPTGSDAIAKTIQFIAMPEEDAVTEHPETALLSTPKTLAAGANAMSATETAQAGSARKVLFRLSAAVSSDTNIWLYWKS